MRTAQANLGQHLTLSPIDAYNPESIDSPIHAFITVSIDYRIHANFSVSIHYPIIPYIPNVHFQMQILIDIDDKSAQENS